ncbi:DUF1508 domain-containing protein [uncultured Sphaerochaeta sp.]|uniref:YegP family protein n=1 Tax=uncultured Sphaerochaeta sp. TaxID=886478 RepID=UPI002A0A307A|nr:DUF1508 domain-containing protein [uncultured Sphaerochaeta sp.]
MSGKFVITKTPKDFYRFSLLAANYVTVLTSKNYSTLRTCREGIETIKTNALAPVSDLTLTNTPDQKFPKYEVYLDTSGLFRFRLLALNGLNIAMAEEGYVSKDSCLKGIEAIGRAIKKATIDETALKS